MLTNEMSFFFDRESITLLYNGDVLKNIKIWRINGVGFYMIVYLI